MKKLQFTIIILAMLFLYACGSGGAVQPTILYSFNTEIDIEVFSKQETVEFIDLVLNDESNQLDQNKMSYDLASVNFDIVGAYTVDLHYTDLSSKITTIKITVNIVDKVKPVITGLKDYTIEINSEMPDFLTGVSASDNYDGNLNLTIHHFDTSSIKLDTVGRYNVKVSISDSNGNEGVYNFTVEVVDTSPAITISYSELKVPQYAIDFDYSLLIQDVTGIDIGYTIRFDTQNINTSIIDIYQLGIIIQDSAGVEKHTETVTITVVPAVDVTFEEAFNVPLYGEVNPEDYILEFKDYLGRDIPFDAYYQLVLNSSIDTSRLGTTDYEFMIKDTSGNTLYSDIIAITVKQPYDIHFNELKVYYNDFAFDPMDLINKVTDHKDDTVNVYLTYMNYIDVTNIGSQEITFYINYLGDTYSETVNVEVIYQYEIIFNENKNVSYLESFDPIDSIVKYIDSEGNTIDLSSKGLQLDIVGIVNTNVLNTYELTYRLINENHNVLFEEKITINVCHLFSIEWNTFSNNVPYQSSFNSDDLVKNIIDAEGNPVDLEAEGISLQINGMVDTNVVSIYPITYQIIDINETVLYEETIYITVYYPYQIIFNNHFVAFYNQDFNPETYITSYLNNENGYVTLEEEGLRLEVIGTIDTTNRSDQQLIYQLIDSNGQIVFEKAVMFSIVGEYQIIFNRDLYAFYGLPFEPESLINYVIGLDGVPIDLSSEELTVHVEGIVNTSLTGTYPVTYQLLNNDQVVVYETQANVIVTNAYVIEFNYVTHVPYNQTFEPLDYIDVIYNHYGQIIDLNALGLSIQVVGTIDTSVIGYHTVTYQIVDHEQNVLYTKDLTLFVEQSYFIDFIDNLTIPYNSGMTSESLIESIYDYTMNPVDLTTLGLTLNIIGTLDTSIINSYSITYQIVDSNQNILCEATIYVLVDYIYTIHLTDTYLPYNTPFTNEMFVESVTDRNGNSVDLATQGLRIHVIGDINNLVVNNYLVKYQLLDSNDTVLYETETFVYVYYPYFIGFLSNNYTLSYNQAFSYHNYPVGFYKHGGQIIDLTTEGLTLNVVGTVDTTDLGNQILTYQLLDETGKVIFKRDITFTVVSQYGVELVTNPVCNYNSNCNESTFVLRVYDEFGTTIDLTTTQLDVVFSEVDTTAIGTQEITYQLLDEDNDVLAEGILNVEVIFNGTIDFTSELIVPYGSTDFDYSSFITSIHNQMGQELTLNEFLQLNIISDVNPMVASTYPVTYQLLDGTGSILYETTINVTVASADYDILFIEDLTAELTYGEYTDFDYHRYISKVVDKDGVELTLGVDYQIVIDSSLNLSELGYCQVNYILVSMDNSILYSESIMITVIKGFGGLYLSEDNGLNIFNLGEFVEPFDYLSLVTLIDENGLPIVFDEHYTYTVDDEVNPNVPGVYNPHILIYYDDELIGETYLSIIIMDPQFIIEANDIIRLDGTQVDYGHTAYIQSISDLDGVPIDIIETLMVGDLGTGYYLLSNGLYLAIEPYQYPTTGSFSVDLLIYIFNPEVQEILAIKIVTLEVYQNYVINYNPLEVIQKTLNFNPLDFIQSVTTSDGTDLVINQDIIISYEGNIDTFTSGEHEITFIISDMSGNELYRETIEYFVTQAFYYIMWNDVNIRLNEYTQETFDPATLVGGLLVRIPTQYEHHVLPLTEEYEVRYTGYINFEYTGRYGIGVEIYDLNGRYICSEYVFVYVNEDIDILFTEPLIHLSTTDSFNYLDYVMDVLHNGVSVLNNPSYTIEVYPTIDPTIEGTYSIRYELYYNGQFIGVEYLIVSVLSDYYIDFNTTSKLPLNDTAFHVLDLIEGIYDRNGNEVSSLGYYYTIETTLDLTLEGYYRVDINLYNPEHVLINSYIKVLQVISPYYVETIYSFDISEGVTTVNDLIDYIEGPNNSSLTLGVDCYAVLEGDFDYNKVGSQTYILSLYSMDGVLLSRSKYTVMITDQSFVVPENMTYYAQDVLTLDTNYTGEDFDYNNFIYALYDDFGNPLNLDYFIFKCRDCNTIEFGASGKYILHIDVYYAGEPDNRLIQIEIVLFISEGYDILFTENLSFNLGEISNVNELIDHYLDPNGMPYTLNNTTLLQTEGKFNPSIPGIYSFYVYLWDYQLNEYLAVEHVFVEIKPLADLMFTSDLIFNIDETIVLENLIIGVYDLNGYLINNYHLDIMYNDLSYAGEHEIQYNLYDENFNKLTSEIITITIIE